MNLETYQPFWRAVEPLMRAKLQAVKAALTGKTTLAIGDIVENGDEESRLALDLRHGDVSVLGLDFVLADADVHGDDDSGLGIRLDIVGYGGLALGGYAPFNFTEDAFTWDTAELIHRVEQMDVDSLVAYIFGNALTNEKLRKDLADAGLPNVF